MMAIAGFSGVHMFSKYILYNVDEEFDGKSRFRVNRFVRLWLLMFGLIGANLGFAMSPIFGDPTVPFLFFTESVQNFFTHIIQILTGNF